MTKHRYFEEHPTSPGARDVTTEPTMNPEGLTQHMVPTDPLRPRPQDQPIVPEALEPTGRLLVLTVEVDDQGNGNTRYTTNPAHAIETLRAIADQIEAETANDA